MDSFNLHVFHVVEGLGNAVAVRLPDETWGVIDWGTKDTPALDKLLTLVGDSRIRFLAASHPHADHTFGMKLLLEKRYEQGMPIEHFFYPAYGVPKHGKERFPPLTDALICARKTGTKVKRVSVDDLLDPDGKRLPELLAADGADPPKWEVRLLSPPTEQVSDAEIRQFEDRKVPGNNTSLVILCRFRDDDPGEGVGRILLTGDATKMTLRFARGVAEVFSQLHLDCQAVLLPHHGAANNYPKWFLKHVKGIAVISAPTDSLHHPHENILQSLSKHCCQRDTPKLFCTSYAGACAKRFSTSANSHLVQPGQCFGDIEVCVPRTGQAGVVKYSQPGVKRRTVGFCGNAKLASKGNEA